MSAYPALRRWALAIALAATVATAGWVSGEQDGGNAAPVPANERRAATVASAAPRARDAPPAPDEEADIDLDKLLQRSVSREFGEIFPSRSWQPPPLSLSARKPEPPRAPPLPFRFFGRMVIGGNTLVFLARQDENYAVKIGDTIEGAYRIEEVTSSTIVLTYLPLAQRQTLQIGSIN